MTKTGNPFLDFDVTKMMSEVKIPGVEMEGLMASYRKNIEAVTKANQLAAEGMQAVMRRQAEIVRQSMEEAQVVVKEALANTSPEEKVAKEADLMKAAFEKALGNMTELAEMAAKSNKEAAEVISGRMLESLEEVKAMAEKLKTK